MCGGGPFLEAPARLPPLFAARLVPTGAHFFSFIQPLALPFSRRGRPRLRRLPRAAYTLEAEQRPAVPGRR